jgi:hypothetical protein
MAASDGAGPSDGGDGKGAAAGKEAPGQQQLDPEELLRQAEEEANIDQVRGESRTVKDGCIGQNMNNIARGAGKSRSEGEQCGEIVG